MTPIGTPVATATAQARHLDKRLGDFRLQDVCLTVPTGLITGFGGANGIVLDSPAFVSAWTVDHVNSAVGSSYATGTRRASVR